MEVSEVSGHPRFKPRRCPIAAGRPDIIDAILASTRVARSSAASNKVCEAI